MDKRILLIISGGIAAYKALELIRRLREHGVRVRTILTEGGAQFVTPLSLSALTEDKVYGDLFSLTDEAEMGHIRLSREADLLVVAPASADILAKMAAGMANDLATTTLLATDKPVMVVPAMNVRMWGHPATQANIAKLKERGVGFIGPVEGSMACGEYGMGRMEEPEAVAQAILGALSGPGPKRYANSALSGRRILVTSGPTHEPIDPVRYIANRSSGKQGHAIATAFAKTGADVILISGPTALNDPAGVTTVHVETAEEMRDACITRLPVDVAVCAAAVADWRVATAAEQKLKKQDDRPDSVPALSLTQNPDILKELSSAGNRRPSLVIGFAAETENVTENAVAKRQRKGCDWIVANDVSPGTGTFGGERNTVHLITADGSDAWPEMTKEQVAELLVGRVAGHFETLDSDR